MDAANIEMVPAPPSPPSSHDSGDRSYRDIHEIEVAIPSIPAPPSPRSSYDSGDRSYRDIHEIEVAIPSIPSVPQGSHEPDYVLDDDDGAIPSIPSPQGSHGPDDVLDDDDGDDDINSFFSFPNSPQQPLPSLNLMERAGRWWRMHREYRLWWVFGFLVGIIIVLVVLLTVHILLSSRAKTCKIKILVSKKGNKGFRSISDALEASPSYSNDQVCIIIKSGEYYETVYVSKEKTNIILKGAGVDRTIIISNGSLDGTIHSQSPATLWINGGWFLARDMTIARTGNGGAAVENWSFYSIFFNCKLKGVNGSLHAQQGSQFYRSCEVYGRNFLISEYTDVFIQKSKIFAEPLYTSEKTVFSTQYGLFLGSNSGFIFHQCSFYIVGGGYVKNTSAAYLGDLLGKYSKIVVIQSYLDESIDYVLVNNTFPNTAEILIFDNFGPGAARKNVSPHVKEIGDIKAASQFSLRLFLEKRQWKLPRIDYDLDISI